jgi:hypothetical protein
MAPGPGSAACGITQTGSPGNYSYTTTLSGYTVNNGNFPVNGVSWGSAARFCNWLTNGQPVGPEGAGTTETGLRVRAEIDKGTYPQEREITDEELAQVRLRPCRFHGDWNYTIRPRQS